MWSNLSSIIWSILILSGFIGSIECSRTRSELYRHRRQVDCDGFRCRNGECIDEDFKCDGKVDCSDASDETDSCKDLMCRGNIFRCKYGACISKRSECDGKKDCRDGSDETSPKCANVLNSKCKSDQFQCDNKQCINIDNKCDGTPHCSDLSDETEEACLRLACPGYTFKCKYGACISRKGRCNGITECFDGSDESRETCGDTFITPPVTQQTPTVTNTPKVTSPTTPSGKPRPPNVYTPGSCTSPPKIENGDWSVWPFAIYDYHPRDLVMAGTTIEIRCKKNHVVSDTESGTTLSICDKDVGWSITKPKCIQICQPIPSTPNTIVTCTNNGLEVSCKAPTEGTKAKFTCPLFYELSTYNDIRFCFDNSWDDDLPHCTPVCGQKSVKIKEMIIGGKKVTRGFYPWTVALYRQHNETAFDLVCGGSLISERIIVTAAHCVTDTYGKRMNKELFRVAAGKYFRTYDHPNDTDAEFSELEEIFVYGRYKASTHFYAGDIALSVSKEPFNASYFIQRICVDWDPDSLYEGKLLNTEGVVTGWGYTVRGEQVSEVSKEISLPYVDYQQCFDATADEFKSYIAEDKMCAGYIDRGIGVCEGDSGGGLAFQANVNNRARYYLRGIVSVAPRVNDSCNEYTYAFYTKVSTYIRFMKPIVQRYRPKN